MTAPLEFHPVAAIFPLMEGQEFEDLKEDIKKNGLIEPVWTYGGKILDGRNRYRACIEADVKPRFSKYGGKDPFGFSVSMNLKRRHLSESQRGMIAARLATMKHGQRKSDRSIDISQPEAAALLNVGEATVKRARKVLEDGTPQQIAAVEHGEITVSRAVQEMKKRESRERLDDLATREVAEPTGIYDVIVIDPPWPMQKIDRDCRPNQVALDYPTMDEDGLRGLKIPAADDCHIWLWTTHKSLPVAFRLLESWGLKYVCAFVWHKPGGIQPVGLPQYNCEFALYARKGTPTFIDTKAFNVCFQAPRGAHSEKPEDFYVTVRRVTAGRRLDMFSRRTIEGFDKWGNEA